MAARLGVQGGQAVGPAVGKGVGTVEVQSELRVSSECSGGGRKCKGFRSMPSVRRSWESETRQTLGLSEDRAKLDGWSRV